MAKKEETAIEMEDVLKAAKKFVKAGKLDDLADTWVENKEKAENPNQIVNLLGQVGEFIKENDIEDKLEDLLSEETTAKKKTSTKKKTASTKKTATKKTTAKKSSSTKKKSSAKKTTKKSS